jgi:hypothetical protein
VHRTRLLAVLSMGIGLLAPLLLAEGALRMLPVRTGLRTLPVNASNPVRRFEPNRAFVFSRDWNFTLVNRGRTNNLGFVNDQDYDSTSHAPLLAVIGDSYIEAPMVPFAETLQGRLARCVGGQGRVYSFGASGAPLSEYLGEAEYARTKFRPDGVLVLVVGNDFDRSLRWYSNTPGFHLFARDSTGLVLGLVTYRPSLYRRILRHSALARYVILNLAGGVDKARKFLSGRPSVSLKYVGNTQASVTPERLHDSRAAVDEFLKELPARAGLPPERIIVMVDAMRPDMYSDEDLKNAGGSYFDLMRRYLMDQARAAAFEVIDMQPFFMRRHAHDGSRFEFATDEHWNGAAHEVGAAAAAASAVFQGIFPSACFDLASEVRRAAYP